MADENDKFGETVRNLPGAEAEQILQKLRSAPKVKGAPHTDASKVMEATRRALTKPGYNVEL